MPSILHGKYIQIAPNIHRVTAPNPSVMTGSGTNTYILGQKSLCVIDPGPLLDEHIDAILKAADQIGGKIETIVVTHTHMDHSPAAMPLAQKTGAKLIGKSPDDHQFQDETFVADIELFDEYALTSEGYDLVAIHTPGHVSNHYCLLETQNGMLFTGDHIMNGSTVVVVPPSGDMGAYIQSLKKLLNYPIKSLGPAHGDTIEEPQATIERIVNHRLLREQKVISAMAMSEPITIEALVTKVYDDVSEELHGVAYFSLWAHLEKLLAEERVQKIDQHWQLRVQ